MLLESIRTPADVRDLDEAQLGELAAEIRDRIVQVVARGSGHLGSNLGVVELTLALHRVFDSPTDRILWDTGHLAYVHKLLTGRQDGFAALRQEGGLSGYPSRAESEHDWIENSRIHPCNRPRRIHGGKPPHQAAAPGTTDPVAAARPSR